MLRSISRRIFLAGACSCTAIGATAAATPHHVMFCATPDVPDSAESPAPSLPRRINGHPIVGAAPDPGLIWRDGDGATPDSGLITLRIAFLDGSPRQHAKVRRIAPQWLNGKLSKRIGFRFIAQTQEADIRIAFSKVGGSWSAIARQSIDRARYAPTMNLSVVNSVVMVDKYERRDVLHEFGHALGLHHELEHPGFGAIPWDKEAVYADLATSNPPWSRAKVDKNIFEHLSRDCVCIGDAAPDPTSIMLYPLRPVWILPKHRNEVAAYFRYNKVISARDRQCIERVYEA